MRLLLWNVPTSLSHPVSKASYLSNARSSLLSGRPGALWHDSATNCRRVGKWLVGYPVETTIRSACAWLDDLADIRHRIAHDSEDARHKFDAGAIALTGHRFGGGWGDLSEAPMSLHRKGVSRCSVMLLRDLPFRSPHDV